MTSSPDRGFPPLDKRPVSELATVYRIVHVDRTTHPDLAHDFRSDLEANKRPLEREVAIPELRLGMSMYDSLAATRELWEGLNEAAALRGQALRIGNFIAELKLGPDQGFFVEDLHEEDGHLTVWGDKNRLAGTVQRIYSAAAPADN